MSSSVTNSLSISVYWLNANSYRPSLSIKIKSKLNCSIEKVTELRPKFYVLDFSLFNESKDIINIKDVDLFLTTTCLCHGCTGDKWSSAAYWTGRKPYRTCWWDNYYFDGYFFNSREYLRHSDFFFPVYVWDGSLRRPSDVVWKSAWKILSEPTFLSFY